MAKSELTELDFGLLETGMDPMLALDRAFKQIIPNTCLPPEFKTHEELSAAFVVQISGDLVIVEKAWYDSVIKAS